MLTTAGFPVPATVRDLSELYLTWGPARREGTPDGTRWSIPAALPLPEDLLRLDPVLTERLDGIRRAMRTGPFLDTLIDQLVGDLGEPAQTLTSLDRLAAATGQDVDDARLALAECRPRVTKAAHGTVGEWRSAPGRALRQQRLGQVPCRGRPAREGVSVSGRP
ncbi:DUF6042 family protein [Streptomyces griseoflavus]|uniref:DUF6042 family protein n=1 Tax=Streptomyces griseoflavus TaxID=35619 RepID=UPI0033B47A28